jgi:FkbM family methyltransferase
VKSLDRLTQTIATTTNFPTALLSRQNKKRVDIKFRNGLQLKLTWAQFVHLRDNYDSMRGFSINQLDDNQFRVKNSKMDLTCTAEDMKFLLRVNSKYSIEQTEDGLFKVTGDGFQLIGSQVTSGLIFLVNEYLNGDYKCDCTGKVVLDIGGFQGETAVFFKLLGAKKVVIYEPVVENHRFIKQNIQLNGVDAEVHQEGVGSKDGTLTFNYDDITVGLGQGCTGSKHMVIKVKDISQVIQESNADIAKLDCEVAEENLTNVPVSTLRKVERYMIESHSAAIKKALIEKFNSSGFAVTKCTSGDPCSLLWFERLDAPN